MKPIFFRTTFILLLLNMLWFSNACHKSSETPADPCKLTQLVSMYSLDTGTSTSTSNFEYNDRGLLSGISYNSTTKDKSGNEIGTSSGSSNYLYDADGFIVKSIYQSRSNSKADGQSGVNSSTEYQYQQGRLAKSNQNYSDYSGGKSRTRSTVDSYEYDASGNNTKVSSTDNSDGVITTYTALYEWRDKKIVKITNIYKGVTTVPLIEVNANGWITKYIDQTGREQRYSYDGEGNKLRIEYWDSGKKNQVEVSEYDTQKSLYRIYGPVYKGHPVNQFYGNQTPTHNYTKSAYYNVDNTGQEISRSSSSYTYQYNSAGYPINQVGTYTDGKGAVTQGSSTDYTYKDCQ
jgi:YD repeat-containing protein